MVLTVSENRDVDVTAGESNGVVTVGACCVSFFLATTSTLASIALWVIEALEGRNFHQLELLFPIASLVLFIIGAHLMDRIDARKAKEYK